MGGVDHYALLGVRGDASAREIRGAYRRLARQQHPDLNPRPDGPKRFAELAQAYAILNDPAQRARYDQTLLRRSTPVRRPVTPTPADVQPAVQRGILELSPDEARHLTHQPLTLADRHGRTIALPAGARNGDEIALLYGNQRVVLTIRPQTKT